MTIKLLGQYQFPISTEFFKNEYCPNDNLEHLANIEIVYCLNNRSIIFAAWAMLRIFFLSDFEKDKVYDCDQVEKSI